MEGYIPLFNAQAFFMTYNMIQKRQTTQEITNPYSFNPLNTNLYYFDTSKELNPNTNTLFKSMLSCSNCNQYEQINKQNSSLNDQIINIKLLNSMVFPANNIQFPSKYLKTNNQYSLIPMNKENERKNQMNLLDKKNTQTSRRKFTEKEDELLRKVVKILGTSNWRIVSSFVPGRTPRQCRDRYTNYLAPGLVHIDWSEDEDKLLAEKYLIHGPQWTLIRQFFPSRSPNDIKNRYNYTVCRKIRSNSKSENIYENDDNSNNNNDDDILDSLTNNDDYVFDFDSINAQGFIEQTDFYTGNDDFKF